MTSGCSTLGVDADKIKPLPVAAQCPHPSVYASYKTFTSETHLKQGETAFQTVKRFRLAEREKNAAGKRLWSGFKACRAKNQDRLDQGEPTETTVSSILSGGF